MSTVYERLVPDYSKYRSRLAISDVDGDESASVDVISPEILASKEPKAATSGVTEFLHNSSQGRRRALVRATF